MSNLMICVNVTLYHKPLVKLAKIILRYMQNVIVRSIEMHTLWKIQTTITLLHDVL